ncbi:MAG: ankyrin repeat domain-containing protein [Devosiaceae bacterium]|nr:ankyrin repeat domain-containing protein [Devosiaceae bacterium]
MNKHPFPFIGELLEFAIRAFSHVDDQNEVALKKDLQRLKTGTTISAKKVDGMLDAHLGYLSAYPQFGLEIKETIQWLISDYSVLVLNLNCHNLSVSDTREILIRELTADVCFAFPLKALMEIGVNPQHWLDNPDLVLPDIWAAFLARHDHSTPTFAKELSIRLAQTRNAIEDKSVEDKLYRWQKTGKMNVRSIIQLLEAGYEALGIALLYGNAFQRFWARQSPELRKSAASNWSRVFDHGPNIANLKLVAETLQRAFTTRATDSAPAKHTETPEEEILDRLKTLTNPQSAKAIGDRDRAATVLDEVNRLFSEHEGVEGLQIYTGRFHVLNGEFKKAVESFDKACTRQAYRNGPAMRNTLQPLLITAAFVKDKRRLKKWADWAETMGLKLDLYRPDALFYKMFPPECYYQETDTGPHKATQSKAIQGNLVCTEEWLDRKPDLQHPDRQVKGYGTTPQSQLYIFARTKQPEKVRKLLDAGANPNLLCPNLGSPLLGAVQANSTECFALLLPKTGLETINQRTRQTGRTCLGEAVSNGNIDMVRALLGYRADPELRGEMDATPLYLSVEFFAKIENGDQLRQHVNQATLNAVPQWMRPSASPFIDEQLNAMRQRAKTDNADHRIIADEVANFFNNGAGVSLKTRLGIAKVISEAGGSPNAKHQGGLTPFLLAAEQGTKDVIELLLDRGANPRDETDDGQTALSLLMTRGHRKLAEEFLAKLPKSDSMYLMRHPGHGTD